VEGLRDYDDLFGSVLEVFAGGRYLWLPFEQVRSLQIPEPSTLMDLLWVPAEMISREGETSHVHLPALYPGSGEHADEQVQLGRTTEWIDCDEAGYRGAGQRILLSGQDGETLETPVLSLRTVSVRSGPIAQETPGEGDA
jgi:type VI secretion system protein ImpE